MRDNQRKEEDEEEEELEMQTIPKGTANIDYGEEFDFKTIRNLIAQERSETKTPKNSKKGHAAQPKFENQPHKQDVGTIMEKLKDTKSLIEIFENYELKTKEINLSEIKESSKTKIKRYKDCVYFGEIINSKRHGKGIMIYSDGRIYEGEWENDLKHGKGLEVLSNGNKYEGQFLNGKPEGVGTFVWTNGEVYEGEWKNGLKHGSGMWRGIKGESYIGEWKNGKADGYGVHTWRNGDRYEGELKGFLKHGQGTERFFNGDFYVGCYMNGKPDGYGEYNWVNGCQYKGSFKNGLRHGKGVWKKPGDSSDHYDGEWVNDKKCGPGTYVWASGNKYQGEYFDDMRHGYGEMYWNDGSYYKGFWERGIQHGEGELMIPDKTLQKGLFSNNEFVGEIEGDAKPEVISHIKELRENRIRYESVPLLPGANIVINSRGEGGSDGRDFRGRGVDRSSSQAPTKKVNTSSEKTSYQQRETSLNPRAAGKKNTITSNNNANGWKPSGKTKKI